MSSQVEVMFEFTIKVIATLIALKVMSILLDISDQESGSGSGSGSGNKDIEDSFIGTGVKQMGSSTERMNSDNKNVKGSFKN